MKQETNDLENTSVEKLIIWALMKINKNVTAAPLLKSMKRQEYEILSLLKPAESNIRYFLAWLQALLLPSTPSESALAPMPLSPESYVSLKVFTQLLTDYVVSHMTIFVLKTGIWRMYCTAMVHGSERCPVDSSLQHFAAEVLTAVTEQV